MSETWLDPVARRQPALWVCAVLLYGVGDGVTTYLGLQDGAVAEVGPVAVFAIGEGGISGLFALKVALFAISFCLWYLVRTPGRVAIPLALTVAGALVTAWNAFVLVT